MATCLQNPTSLITDDLAAQRKKNYLHEKREILTKWIRGQGNPSAPEEEMVFNYTKDQFCLLLTAIITRKLDLRIYFASYKKSSNVLDSYIPAGKENYMTLVFAATSHGPDEKPQNTGRFYILDPTGKDTSLIDISKFVTSSIANFPWVEHYQKNKMPLLAQAPNKPFNGETISLWFGKDILTEWRDEINCWEKKGDSISNIPIFLTAFNKGEKINDGGEDVYVDYQLSLAIDIKPDKTTGEKESSPKGQLDGDGGGGSGGTYDSGKPCPPPTSGCS